MLKEYLMMGLVMLAWNAPAAQSCGAKQGGGAGNNSVGGERAASQKPPAAKPTPAPARGADENRKRGTEAGMKTLAEGSYGPIEETFIAVVRDAETYAGLRALVSDLPELSAEHFDASAVVAAFLGTRRSGGYGVSFTRGPNNSLRVSETTPAKDSLNTMALTSPFKIVSVGLGEGEPFRLEVGAPWDASSRAYDVREGVFRQSGGIAGRAEQYALKGTLRVARLGQLVTLFFDLRGEVDAGPRTLRNVVTGVAGEGDTFRLPRLESGSLVNQPNRGFSVAGTFANGGSRLSLAFEPPPVNIPDGYQGNGKLEAVSAKP